MKLIPATMGAILNQIGCVAALGALTLSATAADLPTHEKFRTVESSYVLIGIKVVNAQNQTLGRVRDMALDVENGRIVELIVGSPSGFLGMGQRYVAVPPGAFEYDIVDRVVRVDMDKYKFEAAPELDLGRWAEHAESRNVAEVYRYFGKDPYFAADGKGSASGNTATEPLGFVQRSSKITGLGVYNLQNEYLGKVHTVMFNLNQGYVTHVVVLAPGMANEKSIIQPRALRYNAAHDGLLLDVTKQAFKDEPRFKWTYGSQGDFKQEAFVNRTVAANDGLNTKQNVEAGIASTYTPLAQGTNFRDVDKTYRIYVAIQADARLSKTAQNVEVGTVNGQTTLRGNVNSEEGKRIIDEIAKSAGRRENVSNLIEVKLNFSVEK